MSDPFPIDPDRGQLTEPMWKATAQADSWRVEMTARIKTDQLGALIADVHLKPVALLLPAFEAAKKLHKSSVSIGRTPSKSKFQVHNRDFLLTAHNPRLRVSLGSVDRALHILNFALHHCGRYGIQAFVDRKKYIYLSMGGSDLRLSVNERFEDIFLSADVMSTGKTRVPGQRVTQGTGELSITIYGAGPTRRLVDKANEKLENQIGTVLAKIFQAISETIAYRAYFNERVAQREAESIKRASEASHVRNLAEQLESMRSAQIQREQNLLVEAAAWHQAEEIRRYADHIGATSESSTQSADPNLPAWIRWAMEVAASLDPTEKRVGGLPSLPAGIDVE